MKPVAPSNAASRRTSDDPIPSEILNWAETSESHTRVPPQGKLLGFRDPLLERAYLRAEHRRGRRYFAISMSVLTLFVASLLWLDPWLLPPERIALFREVRIFLLLPVCILMVINVLWIADPVLWIRQAVVLVVIFGLAHPVLLMIAGTEVFQYLEIGTLEVILAVSLMVGLPVRWSVPIVLLLGILFGVCTLYVERDYSPIANFFIDFAIYGCLGIAASYRYEDIARREFVAQAYSRKDSAERIAAESDRRRWLEVIAAFLRHELKNSITAISTSIEMADRVAPKSQASRYLDRGRRSVQYMHLLLSKVADATNLETALAQHEFELLNLSSLIRDRVEDFRADTPGRTFSTDIEADVHIHGQGDSLVQMLDKLLNNALEHGLPQLPIHIALKNRSSSCLVEISDIGDPLPAMTTQIFEPFVSEKTARTDGANLGLGLYVARAIVVNHGGTITAKALIDPVGARFVVELPHVQRGPEDVRP